MRLIDRLNYRWNYCCDPLPGEYSSPLLRENTRVVLWTQQLDVEKIMFLRRLRALLFGYGEGWTFLDALISFFFGI